MQAFSPSRPLRWQRLAFGEHATSGMTGHRWERWEISKTVGVGARPEQHVQGVSKTEPEMTFPARSFHVHSTRVSMLCAPRRPWTRPKIPRSRRAVVLGFDDQVIPHGGDVGEVLADAGVAPVRTD